MRRGINTILLAAVIAGTAGAAQRVVPGDYTFVQFSSPNGYAFGAQAINDFGTVVGYDGSLFGLEGFERLSNGTIRPLQFPSSGETTAWGINNEGWVVGDYWKPGTGGWGGFIYRDGRFTTYDFPGLSAGSTTNLMAINDLGDFGGSYSDSATNFTTSTAFINERGRVTIITYPGASNIAVYALSNSRDAAGFFQDSHGTHGFIRSSDGHFVVVDVPGAVASAIQGLNQFGWTSGYFNDGSATHGFVRSPAGQYFQIDVPGALWMTLGGINDWGMVTGSFADSSGTSMGFVASPNFR